MHAGRLCTMARWHDARWQAGRLAGWHEGTMARCRLCTMAHWHTGTMHAGTMHTGRLARCTLCTLAGWHDAGWQAVDASIRVYVAPCMDFRGPKSRLEKVEVGTNTRAILSATCFLQQLQTRCSILQTPCKQLQTQCHPCSTWNSVLYSTLCLVLSAIYSPMLSTGLQKTK